ncbi:hypothetical protein [Micromonospora chersina]|uniref:Uncharacterized protein n=1 Tax=Micromonospora chersina TaxID=47854 RepID=A0A1C6URA8_9ACTN|nr:hypothetical protein [Micromonospora chersina]SCL56531.1 hypothetical protein GA0070603_2229 [Micromonospora chersina]
MAILRSSRELALVLDAAIDAGDDAVRMQVEWQATWTDRPCFHCGGHFNNDDRAFLWQGHEQALVMHQKCLLDWLPRVQRDAKRIDLPYAYRGTHES